MRRSRSTCSAVMRSRSRSAVFVARHVSAGLPRGPDGRPATALGSLRRRETPSRLQRDPWRSRPPDPLRCALRRARNSRTGNARAFRDLRNSRECGVSIFTALSAAALAPCMSPDCEQRQRQRRAGVDAIEVEFEARIDRVGPRRSASASATAMLSLAQSRAFGQRIGACRFVGAASTCAKQLISAAQVAERAQLAGDENARALELSCRSYPDARRGEGTRARLRAARVLPPRSPASRSAETCPA